MLAQGWIYSSKVNHKSQCATLYKFEQPICNHHDHPMATCWNMCKLCPNQISITKWKSTTWVCIELQLESIDLHLHGYFVVHQIAATQWLQIYCPNSQKVTFCDFSLTFTFKNPCANMDPTLFFLQKCKQQYSVSWFFAKFVYLPWKDV